MMQRQSPQDSQKKEHNRSVFNNAASQDFLKKREEFAVKLRKERTKQILQNKRRRIVESMMSKLSLSATNP